MAFLVRYDLGITTNPRETFVKILLLSFFNQFLKKNCHISFPVFMAKDGKVKAQFGAGHTRASSGDCGQW